MAYLDDGDLRVLDSLLEQLVEEVIAKLAALPDESMTSPPDAPYTSPWQEYAAQIQGEHSPLFELYEDLVLQFTGDVVSSLSKTRRAFLWLACEDDWTIEYDGPPPADHVFGAIKGEVKRRVGRRAADLALPER